MNTNSVTVMVRVEPKHAQVQDGHVVITGGRLKGRTGELVRTISKCSGGETLVVAVNDSLETEERQMKQASTQLLDKRSERCDCCGIWGIHTDNEGEIVVDGIPHAVPETHDAFPVSTTLMAYDVRGQSAGMLLCDQCAEDIPAARRIMQASNAEGLIQGEELVDIFPGKPEWHSTQSVSLALRRAQIQQCAVNIVAAQLGWAAPVDPPTPTPHSK